jgi:hypothetical protein
MGAILRTTLFFLAVAMVGISLRVDAHHSFAAEFDASKPVTLIGSVTSVEWTNPHISVYIDVEDEETGEVGNWAVELGGPNSLMRLGWRRDSLKERDVVTVEGSLARGGRNLANAQTITMASTGQRMLAGSSRGAEPE